MDQLRTFVIALKSASAFLRFLLTDCKISACRSEERINRGTGKKKQEYSFHRQMKCLFQTITVTNKSGFERYTNK